MTTEVAREAGRSRRRVTALPDSVTALVPVVLAIVGVSIYAATRSDQFLTWANWQNIFQQVAVLGVLSAGTTLLMIAGQLDLSIGSGVALGSVVGAELITDGAADWIVVLAVVALLAAIGAVTGFVVAVTRVAPFILTLGTLSILSAVALLISNTRPIPTGLALSGLSLDEIAGIPLPAIIFVGLLLVVGAVLRFTRLGRNAYALGSNEEAAYLAGIPIVWTKVALFTLSGVTVGLGGILFIARVGSGDPTGGSGLELEAITAVVLGGATLAGGRGGVIGTFLGVMFLGVMGNALQLADVADAYEQLIFGLVLAIAVTWASLSELWRGSGRSPFAGLVSRRPARPAGPEGPGNVPPS